MNKFKIGDKVRRMEGTGSNGDINEGEVCTIKKFHYDDWVYLKEDKSGALHNPKYLELVKEHFDMQKEPWFIEVNEDTYQAVQDWLLVNYGRILPFSEMPANCMFLTNTTNRGRVKQEVMWAIGSLHGSEKEIKLTFETKVKGEEFPEIIDEKQIEIENIRKEMEDLAKRMKQLEGN